MRAQFKVDGITGALYGFFFVLYIFLNLPGPFDESSKPRRVFHLAGGAPTPLDSAIAGIRETADRLGYELSRQQWIVAKREDWIDQAPIAPRPGELIYRDLACGIIRSPNNIDSTGVSTSFYPQGHQYSIRDGRGYCQQYRFYRRIRYTVFTCVSSIRRPGI